MKNSFGQEINPGDIVGLGIRSGNHSEQRVGIVLEFISDGENWEGTEQFSARCAWYDGSQTPIYKMDENGQIAIEEKVSHNGRTHKAWVVDHYVDFRPGRVMISKQMFRFFLLDGDTIDPEIVIALVAAYQEHK